MRTQDKGSLIRRVRRSVTLTHRRALVVKIIGSAALAVGTWFGLMVVLGEDGPQSGFFYAYAFIMAALVLVSPVLTRDIDHLKIRLALSAQLTEIASTLARETALVAPEGETTCRVQAASERLEEASDAQRETASTILRNSLRVERKIPPLLDVSIDWFLTALGAYGGSLLSDRLSEVFPTRGMLPAWIEAGIIPLGILSIVFIGLRFISRAMDKREVRRNDAWWEDARKATPEEIINWLPIHLSYFGGKFINDLEAASALVTLDGHGVRELDYLRGLLAAGADDQTSISAFTWKMGQFGLGIALGAWANQFWN